MARQLIEAMSERWDPEQYHDEYREDLLGFIQKKAELGEIDIAGQEEVTGPGAAKVIDIAGLLKQSLDKAKKEKSARGRSVSSSSDV